MIRFLFCLVRVNYWAREHGLWPDQWCWADVALMNRGYAVGSKYELVKFT